MLSEILFPCYCFIKILFDMCSARKKVKLLTTFENMSRRLDENGIQLGVQYLCQIKLGTRLITF